MTGLVALALFLATIPAANWVIGHLGTVCDPHGPCLIPVWPGIMAPSGVLLIGLALVLRDIVHERLGVYAVLCAIGVGTALSSTFAPASLALASGMAFVLSELADLCVYAPLRKRDMVLAVTASSVVGAVIDSIVFLLIAFGSLTYLPGQLIGKVWMVGAAAVVLMAIDRRRLA